jgi:transposase
MIAIGVDAHKRLHAAVAVDAAGRELDRWQGANDPAGWTALHAWASALGADRIAIEGAWNYGRGLAQYLVAAGTPVYEVNARWTADGRRRARRRDKSDRLDARAAATVALREGAQLPAVTAEDESVVLDLLTSEREAALAEATRLGNQLHALLLQLDPHYAEMLPALRSAAGLDRLDAYVAPAGAGALQQERAAAVRRLAARLRLALDQAKTLERRICALAADRYAPLTRLCGVKELTAGTLAGILGPGRRFQREQQLAAHAGVAPLETSSAGRVRHRLNRGGNRRLNAVLHRIAVTQARSSPEARAYLARRQAEGKTKREAFRALKRYLARRIWRLWQECLGPSSASVPGACT